MPDRRFHEMVTRRLLGKPYSEVHKLKDMPASVLGYKHRMLFHDELSNLIIALTHEDPLEAYLACVIHDVLDKAFTRAKRRREK